MSKHMTIPLKITNDVIITSEEELTKYKIFHFTRKEVYDAYKRVNIQNSVFNKFLSYIKSVNIITFHTQETKDNIKSYVYDPERFDVIIEGLFLLYYELMSDKVSDVDEATFFFINSPFIQEAMVISSLHRDDVEFPDIVYKLIYLLAIYKVGE